MSIDAMLDDLHGAAASAGRWRAPRGPLRATRPQRILLADDDIDLVTLLSRRVGAGEREVHTAISGDVAKDLTRLLHFDLLLLDVNMPGVTGVELTRWVRASRDLEQPAILLISAFPDEAALTEAAAAGADGFLRKPLDLASLRAAVDDVLED